MRAKLRITVKTTGKWAFCNGKPMKVVSWNPASDFVRCEVPEKGWDKDGKQMGKILHVDFHSKDIISNN